MSQPVSGQKWLFDRCSVPVVKKKPFLIFSSVFNINRRRQSVGLTPLRLRVRHCKAFSLHKELGANGGTDRKLFSDISV